MTIFWSELFWPAFNGATKSVKSKFSRKGLYKIYDAWSECHFTANIIERGRWWGVSYRHMPILCINSTLTIEIYKTYHINSKWRQRLPRIRYTFRKEICEWKYVITQFYLVNIPWIVSSWESYVIISSGNWMILEVQTHYNKWFDLERQTLQVDKICTCATWDLIHPQIWMLW